MRYAFTTTRNNVIRRKGAHFWELTFEEFKQYAYETNYITGKGKTAKSWSIDRPDNEMGYFVGNIQPMQLGDNSRKGNKILQYDWQTGFATVTTSKPNNEDDNPF